MTRQVEPEGAIDYSSQSAYSDPGPWAPLFKVIEATIEGVSALARNLVVHHRAHRDVLPEASREDISLRWVESFLDTDQRRHHQPLCVERDLARRVQGCCRDHALLAVAALRHHGVPARSRVGFSSYLSPTWHHDHVVVEAWLGGRWRRFDPEFDDSPLPLPPDPSDLGLGPTSPFLTAANVWLGHRAGSLDVTRFGAEEGVGADGDWFVHSYVISEVAHRFGDELLLWEWWGAMQPDLSRRRPRTSPSPTRSLTCCSRPTKATCPPKPNSSTVTTRTIAFTLGPISRAGRHTVAATR